MPGQRAPAGPARRHGATLLRRDLGLRSYEQIFTAMREFTAARTPHSADELWLVQHPSVFTLGQAGREEHVLSAGDIPLVHSNRGGQVTYHGPGQLVAYTLVDIARAGLGVRSFVNLLEDVVIDLLAAASPPLLAQRRKGAPGVYVGDAKIAALGLRVQRGRAYHGLAINVDMDLEPFSRIDPCGYPGLAVTSLRAQGSSWTVATVADRLTGLLAAQLGADLLFDTRASSTSLP